MPWAFWLGVVLVGSLALLLDVMFVAALVGGGLGVGPAGAVFWTTVLIVIVNRYGRRSAVSLVVDGDDLVWRAPMRTVRVRSADIVGHDPRPRSVLGERPGTLHLADGSSLSVSVPNRRHAILLTAFVDARLGAALARRSGRCSREPSWAR